MRTGILRLLMGHPGKTGKIEKPGSPRPQLLCQVTSMTTVMLSHSCVTERTAAVSQSLPRVRPDSRCMLRNGL